MSMLKKIKTILNSNSGVSLIFVLAAMMLLMAVGTSALVAAGANAGNLQQQKEYSQIMILDESVHRNIMYSLQHDPSDITLLSRQLAQAIYRANNPGLTEYYNPDGLEDMRLDVEFSNELAPANGNTIIENIYLTFPRQDVNIEPPVSTVEATMLVIVDIGVYDSGGGRLRLVTSRAEYEYSGGVVSGDSSETPSATQNDSDDTEPADDVVFAEYGEWRLTIHERVASAY